MNLRGPLLVRDHKRRPIFLQFTVNHPHLFLNVAYAIRDDLDFRLADELRGETHFALLRAIVALGGSDFQKHIDREKRANQPNAELFEGRCHFFSCNSSIRSATARRVRWYIASPMNQPSMGALNTVPLGMRITNWSAGITFTLGALQAISMAATIRLRFLQPLDFIQVVKVLKRSLDAVTLGNLAVNLFIAFTVLFQWICFVLHTAPDRPHGEPGERG